MRTLQTLAVSLLLSTAAAGQTLTGSWAALTAYPVPITNNAVTSTCDHGGCTLYSFMGITNPFDRTTVTAASYKLTTPGTGTWQPIADAPLLNGSAKIAASTDAVSLLTIPNLCTRIFADSFESGNTLPWASTVP